jgi:hypothetical protein
MRPSARAVFPNPNSRKYNRWYTRAIAIHDGLLEGHPSGRQIVAVVQPQRMKPILLAKDVLQGFIIRIAGTFRQPSVGP